MSIALGYEGAVFKMWLNKYGSRGWFRFLLSVFFLASMLLMRHDDFFCCYNYIMCTTHDPQKYRPLPLNATVMTCDDQSSCCSVHVCALVWCWDTLNITVLHIVNHVERGKEERGKRSQSWPFNDLEGEAVRTHWGVLTVVGGSARGCPSAPSKNVLSGPVCIWLV